MNESSAHKLPFSDKGSSVVRDFRRTAEEMSAAVQKITLLEPLTNPNLFYVKHSTVDLGTARLTGMVHTPLKLVREDERGQAFLLPLDGETKVSIDGKSFDCQPGESGFLMHPECRSVTTRSRTVVIIDFDDMVLQRTIAAMKGAFKTIPIISRQRLQSLTYGERLNFTSIFENIFAQIDAVDGDCKLLRKLGVDDSIYRILATVLEPSIFFEEPAVANRKEISDLCEFIKANLEETISLTRMEEISGLSARSLQNAFQKEFGMRPKEWMQNERLHAARKALLASGTDISITDLSYSLGFSSPSLFSQAYRELFGELPSSTRRKP